MLEVVDANQIHLTLNILAIPDDLLLLPFHGFLYRCVAHIQATPRPLSTLLVCKQHKNQLVDCAGVCSNLHVKTLVFGSYLFRNTKILQDLLPPSRTDLNYSDRSTIIIHIFLYLRAIFRGNNFNVTVRPHDTLFI